MQPKLEPHSTPFIRHIKAHQESQTLHAGSRERQSTVTVPQALNPAEQSEWWPHVTSRCDTPSQHLWETLWTREIPGCSQCMGFTDSSQHSRTPTVLLQTAGAVLPRVFSSHRCHFSLFPLFVHRSHRCSLKNMIPFYLPRSCTPPSLVMMLMTLLAPYYSTPSCPTCSIAMATRGWCCTAVTGISHTLRVVTPLSEAEQGGVSYSQCHSRTDTHHEQRRLEEAPPLYALSLFFPQIGLNSPLATSPRSATRPFPKQGTEPSRSVTKRSVYTPSTKQNVYALRWELPPQHVLQHHINGLFFPRTHLYSQNP